MIAIKNKDYRINVCYKNIKQPTNSNKNKSKGFTQRFKIIIIKFYLMSWKSTVSKN